MVLGRRQGSGTSTSPPSASQVGPAHLVAIAVVLMQSSWKGLCFIEGSQVDDHIPKRSSARILAPPGGRSSGIW